jgi:hypothetical protein
MERLEQLLGKAQFPELTIEFFDKVLDGTITNEEFARYLPTLERMGVLNDSMAENDNLQELSAGLR